MVGQGGRQRGVRRHPGGDRDRQGDDGVRGRRRRHNREDPGSRRHGRSEGRRSDRDPGGRGRGCGGRRCKTLPPRGRGWRCEASAGRGGSETGQSRRKCTSASTGRNTSSAGDSRRRPLTPTLSREGRGRTVLFVLAHICSPCRRGVHIARVARARLNACARALALASSRAWSLPPACPGACGGSVRCPSSRSASPT